MPPGLCPLWLKSDKIWIPGLKYSCPQLWGSSKKQKKKFHRVIKLYSPLLTSCDEWLHLNLMLPASLHPYEIQLQYILRTCQGKELQPFYAGWLPKEVGWNETSSKLTAGKSIWDSSVGDCSQRGPGTWSKQRDFVSVTGPSLLRGDKLLKLN